MVFTLGVVSHVLGVSDPMIGIMGCCSQFAASAIVAFSFMLGEWSLYVGECFPIRTKASAVQINCKKLSRSHCYKTYFRGNIDFPKIKKLNKVCSDDWTCTKMLKQCYLKLNYIQTLFICSKMAYSCCFSLEGNLDFLESLQKKFNNIDYCSEPKEWVKRILKSKTSRLEMSNGTSVTSKKLPKVYKICPKLISIKN